MSTSALTIFDELSGGVNGLHGCLKRKRKRLCTMGGWRCSYCNCKVKSDGKTHMFHYPVFDKVRCHQWLVNAGRLDFLDLKVSQLKNRVVCQHHFKADDFMNFKKDKLKFDAVPTIDGPYCDDNNGNTNNNIKSDKSDEYPIMFDDIENEYMTLNDKKANYPVKYADFLCNNELIDIPILDLDSPNYSNQLKINNIYHTVYNNNDRKDVDNAISKIDDVMIDIGVNTAENYNSHLPGEYNTKYVDDPYKNNTLLNNTYQHKSSHASTSKKSQSTPVLIVPPYSNVKNEDNQLSIEVELPPNFNANLLRSNNVDSSTVNMLTQIQPSAPVPPPQTPTQSNLPISVQSSKPKKSRITILSEKKISKPVTVRGKLEPVSTSTILPLPHHNAKKKDVVNLTNLNEQLLNDTVVNQISTTSTESVPPSKCRKIPIKRSRKSPQENSPSISYLKNKITPERVAAIESKRKFNMKLRDIIESFLVKLDDQDKIDGEVKKTETQPLEKKDVTQKVGPYLSKDSEMPNVHDYTIAYLEARMKKMEDNLARKIDQNSERIAELQKSVEHKIEKSKTTGTQTTSNQESDKRRLYQEISQYLSPDANNIIYEELFINKYGQNMAKSAPHSPKRKRPR